VPGRQLNSPMGSSRPRLSRLWQTRRFAIVCYWQISGRKLKAVFSSTTGPNSSHQQKQKSKSGKKYERPGQKRVKREPPQDGRKTTMANMAKQWQVPKQVPRQMLWQTDGKTMAPIPTP